MRIYNVLFACIFAGITALGVVITVFGLLSSTQLIIEGALLALLGVIGVLCSASHLKLLELREARYALFEKQFENIKKMEEQIKKINRE